jgi:hypothetical protein
MWSDVYREEAVAISFNGGKDCKPFAARRRSTNADPS